MIRDNRPPDSSLPIVGELVTGLVMGGAENIAVQLANAHVQAGGEAHLIVLLVLGPLLERVDPRVHLHFLDFRRASIRNPLKFLASIIRGYRLLTEVIDKNRIEVLQTHLPDANLWGLLLALFKKYRVFITIHNNLFFGDKNQLWISRFLIRIAYRMMFRKCDGVIMVSEEVKNTVLMELDISKAMRKSAHVVANGVHSCEPLTDVERVSIRSSWQIQDDDFFIIAGGRFVEAKNFSCLVDAISILNRRGRHPKLIIGGDGPLYASVVNQVADLNLREQIHVPGNLPNLLELAQAADCLAMSSIFEGLPLVLLEGMMRGLPVVGTRIKGLADIVRDGVDGYLVEPKNPEKMAEGIAKLMDNRESAREMGESGRKLVEEGYSFSQVYQKIMEIFSMGRENDLQAPPAHADNRVS